MAKTRIKVYYENGNIEELASSSPKNIEVIVNMRSAQKDVARITLQEYPLRSNVEVVTYAKGEPILETTEEAIIKDIPAEFIVEDIPTKDPTPEEPVSEPMPIENLAPPIGQRTFKPNSAMSPILFMGRNLIVQYGRDHQGSVSYLARNLHVFGIASGLSSLSFSMNNLVNFMPNNGDAGEGAYFISVRRLAIDAILSVLYLDGQTAIGHFKDEASVRAVVDYLDKNFAEGGGLAMNHITLTYEKGGLRALVALLSIQVDQLSRIYAQIGSGKDLAYDTRHYLNTPEAVLIRDRLIDFLETALLVMYLIYNLKPKAEV